MKSLDSSLQPLPSKGKAEETLPGLTFTCMLTWQCERSLLSKENNRLKSIYLSSKPPSSSRKHWRTQNYNLCNSSKTDAEIRKLCVHLWSHILLKRIFLQEIDRRLKYIRGLKTHDARQIQSRQVIILQVFLA